MNQPVRVAVLLSGSGRTLENFLAWQDRGDLPVSFVAVISSRSKVRGVDVAREAGLPVTVCRRRDYPTPEAHNQAMADWLRPHGPEIIALAGYLCYVIRPSWFSGPLINIHPALLPRHGGQGMYGDRVHAAVLAAGDAESGCTVHHVDDRYDHGAVIRQARVPVLPDDDPHRLARRVFAAECDLYPRVLADLARDLRPA